MKKCIYTMIFDDYDELRDPEIVTAGWDYICFSDSNLKSNIWNVVHMDINHALGSRKMARKVWTLHHKFVPDYDLSVMCVGKITPKCNLDLLVKKYLPNDSIDMAIPSHPVRKCIYKEAEKCIETNRDDPDVIRTQIDQFRSEGFPENFGLYENCIQIKRHNRSNLEEHCELVWDQIQKGSFRDQLCFKYIEWKYNLIKVNSFSPSSFLSNKEFTISNHLKSSKLPKYN